MNDVDQIALGVHDRIDWFVRRRGFIDDRRVFTALYALGCLSVVGDAKAALGLGS